MATPRRWRILWLTPGLLLGALLTGASARAAAPDVLRVGTYHGIAGTFSTVQAAVDRAKPGDWILVGPGGSPRAGLGTIPTTRPGCW